MMFLLLLTMFTSSFSSAESNRFLTILDTIRSEYLIRDVNPEISELERIVTEDNIDISDYGLGRGIFNFWRKKTSDKQIKRLARLCHNKMLPGPHLNSLSLQSDEYLRFSIKPYAKVSAISEVKAQEVFQLLKGQETNLVYTEYGNGCESRAHKMAMILDRLCINSAKVFIESERIQLQGHTWSWWYHVAPIIAVQQSYQQVLYALDPALFDKAVPLTTWIERLREMHYYNKYDISLTSKYILLPKDKNSQKRNYAEEDIKESSKRIYKQRFMRFIRYFIGPLKEH